MSKKYILRSKIYTHTILPSIRKDIPVQNDPNEPIIILYIKRTTNKNKGHIIMAETIQ